MTICNGTRSDAIRYSEKEKGELIPIIEKVRKKYSLVCDHDKRLFTGTRSKNNESIISTMESANQSELFKMGKEIAVLDAYINCMERDYYYQFELLDKE